MAPPAAEKTTFLGFRKYTPTNDCYSHGSFPLSASDSLSYGQASCQAKQNLATGLILNLGGWTPKTWQIHLSLLIVYWCLLEGSSKITQNEVKQILVKLYIYKKCHTVNNPEIR